jgi:hypothetical protein
VDRFVGTTNAMHRRKREVLAQFREYLERCGLFASEDANE